MNGQTSRSLAYHEGPTATADHYVYRCYDAAGDLIYIGCTSNVARRMAAHRRGTSKASRLLVTFMADYEVAGPYSGREAGRVAERLAIQAEQPVFNYQGRADVGLAAWMTVGWVAQYLVDHGRRDLAIELACTCHGDTKAIDKCDPWCRAHAGTDVPVLAYRESA